MYDNTQYITKKARKTLNCGVRTRTKNVKDTIKPKSGEIIPFTDIAEAANGDERFTAIAESIHAQLRLYATRNKAIGSAWAIQGKYRQGGNMICLRPEFTRNNGNILVVSYWFDRGDYTFTYGIHSGDDIAIIDERAMIEVDQFRKQFSEITGIEISTAPID